MDRPENAGGGTASRRYTPLLLLFFVASGCAALIYEVDLVSSASLGRRSVGDLPRHRADELHGRHVPGQPGLSALGLPQPPSPSRLRLPRSRHRGIRCRAAGPVAARRKTLRRGRRSRPSRGSRCAPSSARSVCCPRRCSWVQPCPRSRVAWTRRAPECRDSGSSTWRTSRAVCSVVCSRASTCCDSMTALRPRSSQCR